MLLITVSNYVKQMHWIDRYERDCELNLCFFVCVGYDMQFDIKYAYFNFLQSIDYPAAAIGDKDVGDDSRDDEGSKAETSS